MVAAVCCMYVCMYVDIILGGHAREYPLTILTCLSVINSILKVLLFIESVYLKQHVTFL